MKSLKLAAQFMREQNKRTQEWYELNTDRDFHMCAETLDAMHQAHSPIPRIVILDDSIPIGQVHMIDPEE